jgi:hypothetical protein
MQFCAELLGNSTVADSFLQELGVARHWPDQGKCHGTRRRPLQPPPRRHVNTPNRRNTGREQMNACVGRLAQTRLGILWRFRTAKIPGPHTAHRQMLRPKSCMYLAVQGGSQISKGHLEGLFR